MCRLLAYSGPARSLEELMIAPERGLYRQAWDPQMQTSGTVNADGFGVGWYRTEIRAEPALYRSTKPIWSDPSFASMAGLISAPVVVAAVRGATPPVLVEESNVPPFKSGRYLFAHNGAIDGFREGVASRLRRSLGEARDAAILGTTDSEVLFALVLDRLDAGDPPAVALTATVDRVLGATAARLNMILSDGSQIVATAVGDSLATLDAGDGVFVASEPFDASPGWSRVPDRSLVMTDGRSCRVEELGGVRGGVRS